MNKKGGDGWTWPLIFKYDLRYCGWWVAIWQQTARETIQASNIAGWEGNEITPIALCGQASSKVIFPSQRMSNKAMQAIKVEGGANRSQPYTFTFCMERVDLGPYKVPLAWGVPDTYLFIYFLSVEDMLLRG